jgi:hypothetical protein
VANHLRQLKLLVMDAVEDTRSVLRLKVRQPEGLAGVGLRVPVDNQYLVAQFCQGSSKVDGTGGLAHATFLIGED